jgi:hypothetical protein
MTKSKVDSLFQSNSSYVWNSNSDLDNVTLKKIANNSNGVDVKYSPQLGIYIMLFSSRHPSNPSTSPTTYNVCVFTSPNGITNWRPNKDELLYPDLYANCKNNVGNNRITDGFPNRTRGFPSMASVESGALLDKTLPIYFFEGPIHTSSDWRQYSSQWNLRFGLATINNNTLILNPGINAKLTSTPDIYHLWYKNYGSSLPIYRHRYTSWGCFGTYNPGRYNWVVIPSTILDAIPTGIPRPTPPPPAPDC